MPIKSLGFLKNFRKSMLTYIVPAPCLRLAHPAGSGHQAAAHTTEP